ncbi:MAG TPA: hypothetical protein VIN02_06490 [Sulfurovum sp.]
MKKTVVLAICISFSIVFLNAEHNQSIQKQQSVDSNQSKKKYKVEKQIQEQIKREKKYAKEQKFYQGTDYNLSAFEIDEDSLPDVPALEPDYEFDMSRGVYTD